jgi:hypothetical protein
MKNFTIDGHHVSFLARNTEGRLEKTATEFCILVDGTPVPMTLTIIETHESNTGSRTREIEAPHRVSWIASKGCPADTKVEVGSGEARRRAWLRFSPETGYVYNTAVWESHWVKMTFGEEYASVDVQWHCSIDTST